MKFKKITNKLNIIRLGAKHPHGSMKHVYYEVWEKNPVTKENVHYGNIVGGTGDKNIGLFREWKFRAVAKADYYIPSLTYEQLFQISVKVCELNKESRLNMDRIRQKGEVKQ